LSSSVVRPLTAALGTTAEPGTPDPLKRARDRDSMRFAFDLWSDADVSAHADAILARLQAGTMPCDGAWPPERVAAFQRWAAAGSPA
jgi:hypothetical protein